MQVLCGFMISAVQPNMFDFQRRGKTGSPWSTASDSPTPTNSVAERVHPVWEHSATGRGVWPANTGEEHAQLLGNCYNSFLYLISL